MTFVKTELFLNGKAYSSGDKTANTKKVRFSLGKICFT